MAYTTEYAADRDGKIRRVEPEDGKKKEETGRNDAGNKEEKPCQKK